ncbi:MAG TPA: ATP-binding cassette domain-containing protein [Planctomycetota bacterium]|nr:ATP-binding cassette domain-containing protein [Planctomycetota bacterium]
MPALEVRGVTKAYGTKVAVDAASFSVGRGEIFGLLGPNGAGKTSLIRMIMDILRPDSGEIRVLDDAPGGRERVGYLPEERGLYQRQRVGDILQFFGELRGLPRHVAVRRVEMYLDRVGLLETRRKKMRELSKGMQQKIQIAAVLLSEPELMVLDEPFEGLDPVNRVLITDLMKEFAAKGATIVLSSHRMDQVEEMCRSVFLVNQGKGVLSGEVREIKERFADNSVFLECDRDVTAHPAVARSEPKGPALKLWLKEGEAPEKFLAGLIADGAKIRRYERALPSMDEVFVRVVKPS